MTRATPRPFTDRQIELVQTFADQAVIAIENVRLFDEVQARTRELAHSVEQLRATSARSLGGKLDARSADRARAPSSRRRRSFREAEAGAIYVFDEGTASSSVATYGMTPPR